jgi:hypothetical protein
MRIIKIIKRNPAGGRVFKINLGDFPGHPFRGNQWTSGKGEESYATAVTKDKEARARASVAPGKKKFPWQMTREEYEGLPIVYRGIRDGSAQDGPAFFTNDKEIAASHGAVKEYRILPGSKIYPDPEVEGERGEPLSGWQSLQYGSAVIDYNDVVRNYHYDAWKHED